MPYARELNQMRDLIISLPSHLTFVSSTSYLCYFHGYIKADRKGERPLWLTNQPLSLRTRLFDLITDSQKTHLYGQETLVSVLSGSRLTAGAVFAVKANKS